MTQLHTTKVYCALLGCTKVDCTFEPSACNEVVRGQHFTSVARLRTGMSSCDSRKPMNLWNTRAVQTFLVHGLVELVPLLGLLDQHNVLVPEDNIKHQVCQL